MRLLEPSAVAPSGGKQRFFLGIIFGITEISGPDGSFAAPAGLRIVTNGLIWLFKCKRLPIPDKISQKKCQHKLVSMRGHRIA